jgi:protein-S-isoprenylcysteine O-methyltransferase Ste14
MTSQMETTAGGADVTFIPPPLYYGAGLGLGMLLDAMVALPVGGPPATAVAGAAVAAAGLALNFAGVAGVIRNRTTIVPHHPVATLVRNGAYRFSRNPMYTGLGIAYLGAALLLGSWWPVALWPLVMLAVDRLVIRPEERYLSERFGQAYSDYCAHVRRWL